MKTYIRLLEKGGTMTVTKTFAGAPTGKITSSVSKLRQGCCRGRYAKKEYKKNQKGKKGDKDDFIGRK